MDTYQALYEIIKNRRSTGKVTEEAIPKEQIEQILEAGNWAPTHYQTEPWRFYVMTGEGRHKLGEAYARIAGQQLELDNQTNEKMTEEVKASLEAKQRAKAFRSPVVIAVAVAPSDQSQVILIEEFAAAYAAVQNMLLAAHSLGLGAMWRSGEPMYHSIMKESLGLPEKEDLVGLIYIGKTAEEPPQRTRRPVSEKTTWITK